MTNGIKATLSRLRYLPFHPQWLLRFSKDSSLLLKSIQGNVLGIGCGGRWVERELPGEVSYVGLDYFETGVGLYGSVPDVFADAAWLPFNDESFDNVVMLKFLEHVAEPKKL